MNFGAIDIGSKNTACAFWVNGTLDYFTLMPASNIDELVQNLDQLVNYFGNCTHIYIEQQMRSNFNALKIEHQMKMWFKIVCPDISIISFPPKKKYMNIDKNIYNTQYKRKRWASSFVIQYIPPCLFEQYQSLRKKDDIADAILIGVISNIKNLLR
jgi:hypothetical protein